MVYDIVIVGGGPGGIAAAVEAHIFKFKNILMIEKGDNHSQTIRRYYKDDKRVDKIWKKQIINLVGNINFFDGTKESTLNYFDQLLDNGIIKTQYNTEVDCVIKEDKIFKVITPKGNFSAKNVIIAIGRMGRPNKPSYKLPRSIISIINHNTYDCKGNENILVVGGGDSAVEYACQLTTENKVTIAYRRDAFGRVNDVNLEMITRYAQEKRLIVQFSTDIDGIEDFKGKVSVNFSNGTNAIYDRIIYALGGTTPTDFLFKSNIAINEKKTPIFYENNETRVKGLYLVGDILFKNGGSIAMAINHAFDVMKDITLKQDV